MPTPDGGFTGVGNWLVPDEEVQGEPDIPRSFFGGCLYRLSSQGDSLWIHCDTGVVEQAFSLSHELRGMTVLLSGSVVGVGEFSHRDLTGYTRPIGWVVKRDKYGCMEELCVISGLEDLEETEQPQLKVYPNPADQQLTFEQQAEGSLKPATLEIVDMAGKPVHRADIQRK